MTQLATLGGHTQAMLVLLRFCVGGPAATFVLRTCGPWAGDALLQHDKACRNAFEAAVFQVTDMEWRRLQLPASRGGLGLRATAPFAAVAFAAASAEARGRVSTFLSGVSPDLCDPWLSPCLADGGLLPTVPSPAAKLQKQWSAQVVEQLATGIVFPRAQPRGLEFAWITAAVPDPDVWLIPQQPPPHTEEVRCAVSVGLGRPIAGDRCGFCGAVAAGDHVLRCMQGGSKQRAHTRLKHLAAEALRAGGAVVRLEPRPFAGSSARPDVEAVGSSGHPHYVDVGLAGAVSAATYEQQKEQAVRGLLPPNTTFSAVVFDVFGAPGPSAAAWLKKTAGPLAAQRYVATSVATGWLRLWFATAIGSMVAAAVATHLRLQALVAD